MAQGPRIVIAGGGTAGHVLPGLAIARALVARGHDPADILYVGSQRGVEGTLVPPAGFELIVLPGRGIQRRLTIENGPAVAGLARAFWRAWRIVNRRRTSVVVSLGGYAAVPCSLVAALRRVPIVVAEQNAVPGLANRLAGRFAQVSAVSFPGTALPRSVLTGNPVRDEILAVDRHRDRDDARRGLGLEPSQMLLVVFGGSLGARRINEAVIGALEGWNRDDLVVRHIIGPRDFDQIVAQRAAGVGYQPVRYESDMASVFAAADLVVCRAGATSVAEISAIGLPSVLIPLPGAPGDHQTANARALADHGAAVLLRDDEVDGPMLRNVVDRLLGDPERLERMAEAARALGHRDAATDVAELVDHHRSSRDR